MTCDLTCPACNEKDIRDAQLDVSMQKVAGTIAFFTVAVKCPNGHTWVASNPLYEGPKEITKSIKA